MVMPNVNSGPIFPPSSVGFLREPYPARLAVRPAHLLEQGRGGRIVADVVERLDLGMALHVGLPGKDVDLQRLGGVEGCRRQYGDGQDGQHCESFHGTLLGSRVDDGRDLHCESFAIFYSGIAATSGL